MQRGWDIEMFHLMDDIEYEMFNLLDEVLAENLLGDIDDLLIAQLEVHKNSLLDGLFQNIEG